MFLGMSLSACSQVTRDICSLPALLDENSGMLIENANRIWLHNDSGDSAKLYQIDTTGMILKTVVVTNATNFDWEDITQDSQGNWYIADIGNNSNNRQNLKIYKIPNPSLIAGNTVTAGVIHYSYPEQTAFPPVDSKKKYDAEALIYYQDSLYIFTKDRTAPHQGYTWLYQLPSDTGTYNAVLLDSFHTQQINFIFEVTGAAITPSGNKLALLGANRLWLFSDFVGNRFFDGTLQVVNFNDITQKEALDFVDSTALYYSNESSILGSARLKELTLPSLFSSIPTVDEQQLSQLAVYPNPVQEQAVLRFHLRQAATLNISLHQLNGKQVRFVMHQRFEEGAQKLTLEVNDLPAGVYFLKIKTKGGTYGKRLIVVP